MADGDVPTGERLATIEQTLHDVHDDLRMQRESAQADHARLRALETSLGAIVSVQRETIRQQELAVARLNNRLQLLAAAIAFGALALSVALAFIGH